MLGKLEVLPPNVLYTQTFIGIGTFESEFEAIALSKYIKSKFCRTMISVLKATQDNKQYVWQYVPMQDFTSKSDIKWTETVSEIDKQLYKKYDLSEEEIEFIETNVKEML